MVSASYRLTIAAWLAEKLGQELHELIDIGSRFVPE